MIAAAPALIPAIALIESPDGELDFESEFVGSALLLAVCDEDVEEVLEAVVVVLCAGSVGVPVATC